MAQKEFSLSQFPSFRLGDKLSLHVVSTTHEAVRTSQLSLAGRSVIVARLAMSEEAVPEAAVPEGARLKEAVFAEASPLAGFGADDFDLCMSELRSLKESDIFRVASELAASFAEPIAGETWRPRESSLNLLESLTGVFSSPSARFCVESLALCAAAEAAHARPWQFLVQEVSAESRMLRTSAVLDPLSEGCLSQARQLHAQGVSTFKLKCGRDGLAELRAIAELHATFPEEVKLRLDFNCALSEQEARTFLDAVGPYRLEWVEDVTRDVAEWKGLAQSFPEVRLALDEPLALFLARAERPLLEGDMREMRSFYRASSARQVILKPMALGGYVSCVRLAEAAELEGLPVTVSHLFDGPIALDACAELGFALPGSPFAAGLGLHLGLLGFLEQGFEPPRNVERAQIRPYP